LDLDLLLLAFIPSQFALLNLLVVVWCYCVRAVLRARGCRFSL